MANPAFDVTKITDEIKIYPSENISKTKQDAKKR
jgi:hypothetical protein